MRFAAWASRVERNLSSPSHNILKPVSGILVDVDVDKKVDGWEQNRGEYEFTAYANSK
jgi:hypothetical protein